MADPNFCKTGKISDEYKAYSFPESPYSMHTHGVDFGSGYWNYTLHKIYERINGENILIGELARNYGSSERVISPYFKNNKWYFLFSEDYQHISLFNSRLEKLSQTEHGFCIFSVYLPKYKRIEDRYIFDNTKSYSIVLNNVESNFTHFGFIDGCYWGDDSSSKLRLLDLSKVEDGEISAREEYGYLELTELVDGSLKDHIIFDTIKPPTPRNIKILQQTFLKNLQKTES